jgi:hypothetical protein
VSSSGAGGQKGNMSYNLLQCLRLPLCLCACRCAQGLPVHMQNCRYRCIHSLIYNTMTQRTPETGLGTVVQATKHIVQWSPRQLQLQPLGMAVVPQHVVEQLTSADLSCG